MKAYLVIISPMVRVIVDDTAKEEEIVAKAIEKIRKDTNEYISYTYLDDVKEDTECPYNPETDK